MNAVRSLSEVRRWEGNKLNRSPERQARLIGIVFCRPYLEFTQNEIVPSLDHWNCRSGSNVAFFFAGYQQYSSTLELEGRGSIVGRNRAGIGWLFDDAVFNSFREELESETTWRYSGGCELILADARRNSDTSTGDEFVHETEATLDLTNAVIIQLDEFGSKPPSVNQLFEGIF